jgi:outer membrane protein OmpA-like peptidoglycan-associated protein
VEGIEYVSQLSRRSLIAATLALWPAAALAGPQPGGDDRRVDDSRAGAGEDQILDATQTVQLEHDDRIYRLRQATQQLGISPPPEFRTYTIPASRMPDYFNVDTPILRVIFSDAVFFDTGSDRPRRESDAIIAAVSQALRGDAPDAAVFVCGHTDNRGGEDYNYNLSVARANAVAERLLDRGVGEVALWRVGFGEAVPLYPNDTPEDMGYNRRVEFLFSARTEGIFDYLSRQLDSVCVGANVRTTDSCMRQVSIRENFTAVQLTRRPLGVGLAEPSGRGGRGGRGPGDGGGRGPDEPSGRGRGASSGLSGRGRENQSTSGRGGSGSSTRLASSTRSTSPGVRSTPNSSGVRNLGASTRVVSSGRPRNVTNVTATSNRTSSSGGRAAASGGRTVNADAGQVVAYEAQINLRSRQVTVRD